MDQRNLTGEGREERKQVYENFEKVFGKIFKMEKLTDDEKETIQLGWKAMCDAISRERARIGGDWAVAGAIPLKEHRDLVRKLLGPQLVIVILTMPQTQLRRRLQKRHFQKDDTKSVDVLMVSGLVW